MNRSVAGVTLTAVFTALMVAMAVVSLPLPTGAISLALLGVYITAYLLPMRYAVLSAVLYVLLGVIGLPVFAGFGSGLQVLLGPTGGYIASYPLVAAIIAATKRLSGKRMGALAVSYLAGLAACYLCGTAWFCIVTAADVLSAAAVCIVPFIAGDAVKIIAAVLIAESLERAGVRRKIGEVL